MNADAEIIPVHQEWKDKGLSAKLNTVGKKKPRNLLKKDSTPAEDTSTEGKRKDEVVLTLGSEDPAITINYYHNYYHDTVLDQAIIGNSCPSGQSVCPPARPLLFHAVLPS